MGHQKRNQLSNLNLYKHQNKIKEIEIVQNGDLAEGKARSNLRRLNVEEDD